jgi:hypothetical protein
MLLAVGCELRACGRQLAGEGELVHLRLELAAAPKLDLLLVVDNSRTMAAAQAALRASFGQLLGELAAGEVSYRVGIVSTDVYGALADCGELPWRNVDPALGGLGKGNCDRADVRLVLPHDGARGRLVAAMDPSTLDPGGHAALDSPDKRQAFADIMRQAGARWLIDGDALGREACSACGCGGDCASGDACFGGCAKDVARALGEAYLSANIAGLGVDGSSYESGLLAASWALGIDPQQASATSPAEDAAALAPAYDLTRAGGANCLRAEGGVASSVGWLRADASLALLFVSDEQDCSMPRSLYQEKVKVEQARGAAPSSMCYWPETQASMLSPALMARLVAKRKGSWSRVTVGFVGGLTAVGAAGGEPACEAQVGTRYLDFANLFSRHALQSICLEPGEAAAVALGRTFASLVAQATMPCFAVPRPAEPAGELPDNISVGRQGALTPLVGEPALARVACDSAAAGWCWQPAVRGREEPARVCLVGVPRRPGDVYDIAIRHR